MGLLPRSRAGAADPLPQRSAFHAVRILAQGRTGSRLLCELLDSHSQIDCGLELLNDPVRDAFRYVHNHALASSATVYGFKVKPMHIQKRQALGDTGDFLQHMSESGWKIVHLKRRNLFRQTYSGLARQARGAAHSRRTSDGSSPARPVIRLEVERLINGMRYRQKALAQEEEALSGLPHETIVYEDDLLRLADQRRATSGLVEWLGLRPEPLDTNLVPNSPPNLRGLIANFEEVRAGLVGTEFEGFFLEATGG